MFLALGGAAVTAFPCVDESLERLHKAGWTVGEAAFERLHKAGQLSTWGAV
jgi:hypothetical protein